MDGQYGSGYGYGDGYGDSGSGSRYGYGDSGSGSHYGYGDSGSGSHYGYGDSGSGIPSWPGAPHAEDQRKSKAEKRDDRTVFVGGIAWGTTEGQLQAYFGKFGEVEDIKVEIDETTGKPRGFAFITFKDPNIVPKVIKSEPHTVDNKTVEVKCSSDDKSTNPYEYGRSEPGYPYGYGDYGSRSRYGYGDSGTGIPSDQRKSMDEKKKGMTIFVGGIANGTTEGDLQAYFGTYGEIEDINLKVDKDTGKQRGFGFITFKDPNTGVLQYPFHQVNGKKIEIKAAEATY